MTKHVAAYVLGQPSEYERQALLASFERKGDLRSLMKRALELYVEREQRARSKKHVPASSALPPPSSVAATELVTLRPESVELLDDHCLALCHTTGLFGRPPEDHTLSRAEVAWTLAYVSNELMPLRMSLAKEPREKLILSLIDDAWHNNQRLADAARTRFLGPLRAPTAHNTELFLPNLPENSTNRIERFLIPSQTVGASIRRVSPGTAALLYAHATSRCVTRLRAQTGRAPSKQDIQACLETTIDPAVLSH